MAPASGRRWKFDLAPVRSSLHVYRAETGQKSFGRHVLVAYINGIEVTGLVSSTVSNTFTRTPLPVVALPSMADSG